MTENETPAEQPRWTDRRAFAVGIAVSASCVALPPLLGHAATRPMAARTLFAPAMVKDGVTRAIPSEAGFDATAFRGVLKGVQEGATNVHGLLVARNGHLVAELYRAGSDRSIYSVFASYRTFDPTVRHDMRSVSKSVTSLLYGILLARGEVPAIDTPVASLFPEYFEIADTARRAITIRHLLSMTSGLEWNEPSPVRSVSSNDETGLLFKTCAYRYVFGHAVVAAPGQKFTYSGGATAVIAEIMARATRRSLRDIAGRELFEPLGVVDWEWLGNIRGVPLAAAGLRLKPRDLMKIGMMMLAKGVWQGRQVVPAAWIAESTRPHVVADPLRGYGFQWWSTSTPWRDKRLDVTAAIGNGGQRLFLVPKLDLAVVMTAGDYNDPAIAPPLDAILRRIVATVFA